MKTIRVSLISVVVLIVLAACSRESVQGTLARQDFGTAFDDEAFGVAAPKGGIGAVVVGYTEGALDGVNKGDDDAFIRKYDGGVVWAQQFGTRGGDQANDVAVTKSGISYVLGNTRGALGFKVGSTDVFLRKYDANGVVQWTRQFGTTEFDIPRDVTLDNSGNVYVLSNDDGTAFTIRKFNPSGTLLKTITNTRPGATTASALAVDSLGNIFALTHFALSSNFNFVALSKYNSSGNLVATMIIFRGVGKVTPSDLIVDSSNTLYFSVFDNGTDRGGYIGRVNNAGINIFLARIEPSATGTVSRFPALALDSIGSVYVTGTTVGAYPGFTNAGGADIFVLKYAPGGTQLWARQFGGNSRDEGWSIAVSDAVYVAGSSSSNPNLLGDASYGSDDAFLAQLDRATGAILGIDQ